MTWLQGRVVRFKLSPEGKEALSGIFEKDSMQALVEFVDDLGVWILIGRAAPGEAHPVVLLKWDYFATAAVDIEPVVESPRSSIGFSS
jgi:hypothetical protein